MTPADLRALASRVETEEPSDALNEDVARALGWKHYDRSWWIPPELDTDVDHLSDFLTDLTAAASAMPEGWRFVKITCHNGICTVDARRPSPWLDVISHAPTEPRARVAAALRARAADLEAGNA